MSGSMSFNDPMERLRTGGGGTSGGRQYRRGAYRSAGEEIERPHGGGVEVETMAGATGSSQDVAPTTSRGNVY